MTLHLLFDEYKNVTPEQQQEIAKIHTAKDLHKEIEKLVVEKKLSYLDAVIHYCQITGLEFEVAGNLIKNSSKLKALIQQEAEELNYLPKTGKLPL